MRPAERAAWERFQLGKRLHQARAGLSFGTHRPAGLWTPDYRGKAGRNKAGSWQARLVAVEQGLMKLELERIARTL